MYDPLDRHGNNYYLIEKINSLTAEIQILKELNTQLKEENESLKEILRYSVRQ